MSGFFHVVDRNVAGNPVARAIQRSNVDREVRGFRIAMYLTPDGDPAEDDIRAAHKMLQVALCVAMEKEDHAQAINVMRGGLSALKGMADRGYKWRAADTPAVDVAMERALDVYMSAHYTATQRAWQAVQRAEMRAPNVRANLDPTA